MFHFTQDASSHGTTENSNENAYTNKSLPMLISLFDSIYPSASPFFFRALFIFFLIIIIFTHVFCLSIFGSFSRERLFNSDSPHYFYCYFSVWLNMNWVSMRNFIVECEEHTSKHTAWHIDTHFWSANNFVCLRFSFANSSNIWIKTSSRICGIWSVYTWIKINCL